MAEGGGKEDRFRCAICFEVYVLPKLLPCFHTFCVACLRKYIQKNVSNGLFSCPMCRKVISLPETGVAGFQTNFYITQADDNIVDRGNTCTACDIDAEAEFNCEECGLNLCTGCSAFHRRMKATRHHTINAIGNGDNINDAGDLACTNHPTKKVNSICKDCSLIICEECLQSCHKKHNCSSLTDEAKRLRENLKCVLESNNFTEQVIKRKTEAGMTQQKVQNLTKKLDNAIKKCQEQAAAITEFTKLTLKEKQNILAEHLLPSIKSNRQIYEDNRSYLESTRTMTKTWTEILAKEDDTTLVKYGTQILENISHIANKSNAVKPVAIDLDENKLLESLSESDNKLLEYIETTLGHFKGIPRPKSTYLATDKLKLQKLACFPISSPCIYTVDGIAPLGDGMAWINTEEYIHLIDSTGTVYQSVSCSTPDIATGQDHTCLIASSNRIQAISPSGIKKDVIRVKQTISAFAFGSLSSTTSAWNGVYIGQKTIKFAGDWGTTITEMSCIRFSDKNEESLNVDLRNAENVLLAVDKTSDKIAIAEHNGNEVRILSTEGILLAKYQRDLGLVAMTGITFDFTGCVVAVNSKGGEVLRVGTDGLLRQVLLKGLDQPLCVTFDIDRNMWIGSENGHITVYKITKL